MSLRTLFCFLYRLPFASTGTDYSPDRLASAQELGASLQEGSSTSISKRWHARSDTQSTSDEEMLYENPDRKGSTSSDMDPNIDRNLLHHSLGLGSAATDPPRRPTDPPLYLRLYDQRCYDNAADASHRPLSTKPCDGHRRTEPVSMSPQRGRNISYPVHY